MSPERKIRSILSSGTYRHLRIAVALLLVLPLLSFVFIVVGIMGPRVSYPTISLLLVGTIGTAISCIGYLMLRRYPANIERLRNYLKDIAEGEFPEKVSLLKTEDDISAIEKYLNLVLVELRQKVALLEEQLDLAEKMQATIRVQAEEILDAERHRVMIQSLAAACHHIGQPATVLRAYLDMLQDAGPDAALDREKINECRRAAEVIAGVLGKLRQVSEYRTVPYTTAHAYAPAGEEILDIDS